MDGTIEVTDTAIAPAQSGQDTQTSAPAQTSTDTVESAGTEGQQPQVASQPQGNLDPAAAAEAQRATEQQQQQQQMLAGKFKTPQELEKGYLEVQRLASKQAQEKRQLEERIRSIEAQASGRQPDKPADPFMDQWNRHPLSQMPDPRYNPNGHKDWVENTFTPHFLNNPAGTIRHLVQPQMKAAQEEWFNAIRQEFNTRDVSSKLSGFFGSKPEWLTGKTVNEAFQEWGDEGLEQYRELLDKGVPVENAVEMVALRRGRQPLQAAADAAQAKEADLRKLATTAPNRGNTFNSPQGLVGEGESLAEMVANSMAAQGQPLLDMQGKTFSRTLRAERKKG